MNLTGDAMPDGAVRAVLSGGWNHVGCMRTSPAAAAAAAAGHDV